MLKYYFALNAKHASLHQYHIKYTNIRIYSNFQIQSWMLKQEYGEQRLRYKLEQCKRMGTFDILNNISEHVK